MKHLILGIASILLVGCTGMPESVTPVKDFNLEKYLGTWYEVARLDHSFERGLDQVTAEYSMREDGGVRVKNRGFSASKGRWQESEGKAYFVGDANVGHLKVSFFGPFYGSYVIFELDDPGYQYAYVTGPNKSYLWFLSRTPQVSEPQMSRFVQKADALGYDIQDLIYVAHE